MTNVTLSYDLAVFVDIANEHGYDSAEAATFRLEHKNDKELLGLCDEVVLLHKEMSRGTLMIKKAVELLASSFTKSEFLQLYLGVDGGPDALWEALTEKAQQICFEPDKDTLK